MANHTRRRSYANQAANQVMNHQYAHQHAGAFPFFETPDDSVDGSEARINSILSNIQTTREDLHKELKMCEGKMTMLEAEFNRYQKIAYKVMNALDALEGTTEKLTEVQNYETEESDSSDSQATQASPASASASTSQEPKKEGFFSNLMSGKPVSESLSKSSR